MAQTSALIGYTGFVGGNLDTQRSFTHKYNTKNIDDIDGQSFDLVICSATKPEMWIANADPEGDLARIQELMDHLETIKAKQFVLISTIAVYTKPIGVDEDSDVDVEHATPYGVNRYQLEQFCQKQFDQCLVVRLPGLFGNGLKKNIIFDFLHDNNIDRIDSRAVYQFYNLDRIWSDIKIALDNKLSLINLGTEPTSVAEVAKAAFGLDFSQETLPSEKLPNYDMHSKHASQYGQAGHYLSAKAEVLQDITKFVARERAAK
jgi:nucleoside-diphosphate-sugar epimerase